MFSFAVELGGMLLSRTVLVMDQKMMRPRNRGMASGFSYNNFPITGQFAGCFALTTFWTFKCWLPARLSGHRAGSGCSSM